MATDINTKTLVLTDLQPPPLCRFMKVKLAGYGFRVDAFDFINFVSSKDHHNRTVWDVGDEM